MRDRPVVPRLGHVAATLALALTVLASVRQRRPELALLKSLGMRPRQIRAIVAWQATVTLTIAAAAGIPLGVVAGRWAWTVFAGSIGVVPSPQVPVTLLAGAIATLLIAGNLLSAAPGAVAARITPAAGLRQNRDPSRYEPHQGSLSVGTRRASDQHPAVAGPGMSRSNPALCGGAQLRANTVARP